MSKRWQKIWLLLALVCFATSDRIAGADTYYVNGKAVSGGTYQAYRLMNKAVTLMRQNQTEAAAAGLRRALQYAPTLSEAHTALGIALARLGKLDEATEQLRMAIADDPDAALPRLNLGGIYQSDGRLKDALNTFEQFLREFPDCREAESIAERVNMLRVEIERGRESRRDHSSKSTNDNFLRNVKLKGAKRWASSAMPLKIYLSPGVGLKDFRPEYEEMLRSAFAEWQKRSQGKVSFVYVNSASLADIRCRWIDDPSKMASTAEDGEAQVRTLLNSISGVDVLLSINSAGSIFPLTDNLVRSVALHEIGHSLGLVGHSENPQDIMFSTSPFVDVQKHLSARDVNTLQALYSEDLDAPSQAMTWLQEKTHGRAVQALQGIIVVITIVVAAVIGFFAVLRKVGGNQKRSTRKK